MDHRMRGTTMTTRRRSSSSNSQQLPFFSTTTKSSPSNNETTTTTTGGTSTTTSPIINGSSNSSSILLMSSSNNSNNNNKMGSNSNKNNGSTTTSRRHKRRRRLLFWGFRLGSNFNGWRGGVGGLLLVALLVLLICFLVSSSLLVLLEESSSNSGEAAAPPPFLPSLRHDHGGSQPQQQQEDVVERQQQQTRQLATDDGDEFDDQEIQQDDDDDDGIMSGDDGSMDDAVDDHDRRRGIIKQQQSQQQQHWTHRIPNVLTFTHRYNLLQPLEPQLSNANLTREEMDELYALQTNVQNIIEMHNNNTSNAATKTKIHFWTDDDCIRALELYDHDLAQYFQNENVGMYKADICRGIALYKHGGLYFDVDLGVRMLLWDVLKQKTEFVTIRVHHYSKYKNKGFFQAFIGCVPKHPVIKRYLDLFLDYYQGKRKVVGPLGVLLLKQAYDDIQKEQENEELQKQQRGLDNDNNDNTQRKTKINTHLNKTTVLWQEVLYVPQLQKTVFRNIPPPTWGTRRACKFVVLSSPALPVSVPFYSRIANSRMCPAAAASASS